MSRVLKEIRTKDKKMLICNLVEAENSKLYIQVKNKKKEDMISVEEFLELINSE